MAEQGLKTYIVHLTGGATIKVQAAKCEVRDTENRIYFYGADGERRDDPVFLANGISAIEIEQPSRPVRAGNLSM